MFWLLFGLLYTSLPTYVYAFRATTFNCSETICESKFGQISSYETINFYCQKFQVIGIGNCSDCGVYTVKLYDVEKKLCLLMFK